MEKLQFEEVCFLKLVPDTRYFIAFYKNHDQSHQSAKFLYYTGRIATFTESQGYFNTFRKPWSRPKKVAFKFNSNRKYYALVPQRQKIQEDMEQRALLLILRKLIDESFMY